MTVDLDTRLRSACESLVRASQRPSPAGPPRSLRPVATVVAAVVSVVALVAGTVAIRGAADDDDRGPVATSSMTVPLLIADVVPDGLRPLGVVELPTDGAGAPTQTMSLYGDPTADDPFAVSDLAVRTATGLLPSEQVGEAVTVRGHGGFVDDARPFAITVSWEEVEGFTVALTSRTLDVHQLVAIAEGLAIDADAKTVDIGPLPDALPGPLAPVAAADLEVTLFGMLEVGLPLEESATGHVAAYQSEDYGLFGSAFVATFTGDETSLTVLRWLGGATTETDVRGHRGWSGSYELPGWDDGEGIVPGSQGPLSTVVWEDAPGVLVLVQTFGPDLNEAQVMAESLRPTTDDEWARMLRLGDSRDRFTYPEDGIASIEDRRDSSAIRMGHNSINGSEGVYGTAGVWSTWLLPDGSICGAVDDVDDSVDPVETCDSEGGPVTLVHDDAGEPVLLIGILPDSAVGRIAVGGQIDEAQTCTGPQDAPPYYILVIADGQAPSAVTFVAADGTELDTVPVEP